MSKNQLKKLGKVTIIAKEKVLFEHSAHNIPPLGVKVGYTNELNLKDKQNPKISMVGKIIDIIGPVKDPFVVVKIDKSIEHSSLEIDKTFYYVDDRKDRKDRKKKKYSKKTLKGKRNKK